MLPHDVADIYRSRDIRRGTKSVSLPAQKYCKIAARSIAAGQSVSLVMYKLK